MDSVKLKMVAGCYFKDKIGAEPDTLEFTCDPDGQVVDYSLDATLGEREFQVWMRLEGYRISDTLNQSGIKNKYVYIRTKLELVCFLDDFLKSGFRYLYFHYLCKLKRGIILAFSSRMEQKDFILEIYKAPRTVFGVSDVAMLFPNAEGKYLSERLRYYVQTWRLVSPRKGIYAKPGYNPLELANILYTPSYISLEYVLQQAGVVFQFDSRISSVSYLSRELGIDGRTYSYRRIREDIIMSPDAITRRADGVNIATPERAFLDTLYLDKDFYFDNLNPLDRAQIARLVPAYRSAALEKRVAKLLRND